MKLLKFYALKLSLFVITVFMMSTVTNSQVSSNAMGGIMGDVDCFKIQYPLTYMLPNGTTKTVDDEEAAMEMFHDWFRDNPDTREFPTLHYPITIVFDDGTEQTIASEEELLQAYEDCWKDEDWKDEDRKDGWLDAWISDSLCFEIEYPISVTMPDNSVITGADADALKDAIETWYENNPNTNGYVAINFPITLNYGPDSTGKDVKKVINDIKEYFIAVGDCFNDDWDDDYNGSGNWGLFCGACFEFQFPMSVMMPDSTIISANTEDSLNIKIREWEKANPRNLGTPAIIFPVTIVYEDGTTKSIANEETLWEAYEDCFDDNKDDWGKDDQYVCFELVYPISVKMPDDTVITGNNEEELLISIMGWFEKNPDATGVIEIEFVFPVTVKYKNGDVETFYSDAELQEAWRDCYGDDAEEGDAKGDCNAEGKIGPSAFLSVNDNVFTSGSLFPNPATDMVTIKFTSTFSGNATMAIVDANGNTVITKSITTYTGDNTLQVSVAAIESGRYFVRIINTNGVATIPLTIVK